MNEVIAGIDIGGTKIAVALETLEGEKIAARRLPTDVETGAYRIVEKISRAIAEMLEENRVELVAIGVGCPSPLDVEKGLVMSPANLRGWDNFPIVKLVQERFQVPVVLDNDANTATLGEYVYGAGRGFKNIVYITVSTGVGGGIIINGEIIHGVGAGAGELGHTIIQPEGGVRCNCGSTGCLETICAGVHIARRAKERLAAGEPSLMNEMVSNINDVTAKTVVEAVRRKDKLASEIWTETCRFLAVGVGNIITLIAPEAVIIGGGVASAGELLFTPLRSYLPEFVSMVPLEKVAILPAELGGESGVCGALVLAERAYKNLYQFHAI
ncbi:MAG: ROK family protein [Acidobacteriota bacterium]|nr:ROK family protein [Acidobacteriota bacterium]